MLPTLSSGHVSCPDIVWMGVIAGWTVVVVYLLVSHIMYFCLVSDEEVRGVVNLVTSLSLLSVVNYH